MLARHFYTFFPQFCREPLNDAAWYPGFTDWDLIRKLPEEQRNRFSPKAGYYDLANDDHIGHQFNTIGSDPNAGIALYHYHFDGRFVLDSVERHILRRCAPMPPFFLIWANESWTKRWVGKPGQAIVRQHHSTDPGIVHKHVERLSQLMQHPAYFRLDGKPIFYIYAPHEIGDIPKLLDTYRHHLSEHGLDPHIGFCASYIDPKLSVQGFDSCVEFHPRLFFNTIRAQRHSGITSIALALKRRFPALYEHLTSIRDQISRSGKSEARDTFAYDLYLELTCKGVFQEQLRSAYRIPTFRGLFYSWNNFPRYGSRSIQVTHQRGDYAKFHELATQWKDPWVLVNSWNEWSEGAALEPGALPPQNFELFD